MTRLSVLALLACVFTVTCASLPTPGTTVPLITVSTGDSLTYFHAMPEALDSLSALATRTFTTRREQAACVSSYAIMGSGSTRVVFVRAIQPAKHVTDSDSIHVFADGDLCPHGEPGIHSHVFDNGWLYIPSGVDSATQRNRGSLFDVLVSVENAHALRLTLYGMAR